MATRKPAAPAKTATARAAAKRPAPSSKGTKATTTPATVTLKQMAAGLAENHELPRRQVEAVLGELVETFTTYLKKGTKIRVSGLGTFQVRTRPARMGRNPATGEQIQIKASKKIAFRPAKELKEGV